MRLGWSTAATRTVFIITASKHAESSEAMLSPVSPYPSKMSPAVLPACLYNEPGWKQALADYRNYWTWRRERNDARWQQQERGGLDFDAKNMMHTVRLLLSGRSLMQSGRPIVRFEGDQLELLLLGLMIISSSLTSYTAFAFICSSTILNCPYRNRSPKWAFASAIDSVFLSWKNLAISSTCSFVRNSEISSSLRAMK